MYLPKPNEVLQVSFQYYSLENWKPSPFGRTKPEVDPNYMCVYCKNEDTNVVQDKAILNMYSSYFKTCLFWKMINCTSCTSTFLLLK
jgi:hypothetical protein